MRRVAACCGPAVALLTIASLPSLLLAALPVDYVDTFIGTGGVGFGIGSINPGAQVPFGALRLGPDTSLGLDPLQIPFNHFGGYYYNDDYIRAFSHTHMVGSGVQDWGNFGVMPIRGTPTAALIAPSGPQYHSRFHHASESSSPGYYTVRLEDWNATAELTAGGTHAGIHRYTYDAAPDNQPCGVLIDICHSVETATAHTCRNASLTVTASSDNSTLVFSGWLLHSGGLSGRSPLGGIHVYMYAVLSPVASSGLTLSGWGAWENGVVLPGTSHLPPTTSGSLGAYAMYNQSIPGSSQALELRVGISFIDATHAQGNYNAQLGGGTASFDSVRNTTSATWNQLLSRVSVSPATPQVDCVKLYSALYRTFMSPTTYSEWDGQYLGFDNAVHTVADGPLGTAGSFVSDLSLWDIHRTQVPWMTVVNPDMGRNIANSLLTMYEQGGHLPRWPLANIYTGCMSGSHGIVSFSEAILKGLGGVNTTYAYQVMLTTVAAQDEQNGYSTLGYVPQDTASTATSLTLEFAFDDGVMARAALFLNDTATATEYFNRSKNYRNVYDAAEMFMCPKYSNGTMQCPWLPTLIYPLETTYTEGDAWQWQWSVPHDMSGLVSLYPSPQVFADRLDLFLNQSTTWFLGNALPSPYYWAGNEPDILAPWQFASAGEQFAPRTQHWTRWLLDHVYTAGPEGIPGNDDYGCMSAWQMWAYFGLYPSAGDSFYILGSPGVPAANITLPTSASPLHSSSDLHSSTASGPSLTMVAHSWSPTTVFVSKVVVNGVPLTSSYVQHATLFAHPQGNVIEFYMADAPASA